MVDLANCVPEPSGAQASVSSVHAEDGRAGIDLIGRRLGFFELGDPDLPCLDRPG